MVGTARMEQGEPHFLEAREGIALTYDSSATGVGRTTVKRSSTSALDHTINLKPVSPKSSVAL